MGHGSKFAFYTRIELTSNGSDQNLPEKPVAQLGMIHGFAESSDTMLEPAFGYALNGILVHLIDLEGYGFSAGVRISGP